MLKIGVIGLGNIALKAYLPIYIANNHQVEFHYFTRNQEKMHKLEKQYNLKNTYTNLDEFFNLDLDACMIHTPTDTHYNLIDRALNQNWHVFVDKPISESYEEVVYLLDKANKRNLILFTGFNRRYAPLNKILKEQSSQANQLIVQKTREKTRQDAQFAIFDMMIHMLDISLYLLDEEIIDYDINVIKNSDNTLKLAAINFKTQNKLCACSINMFSGAINESIEMMSEDKYLLMNDLDQLKIVQNRELSYKSFSDWDTSLYKRGFVNMFEDFIKSVDKGYIAEQEISRLSHYYCMLIAKEI